MDDPVTDTNDPAEHSLPLVERKKLQAQRRIQAAALTLIRENSYDEVTVDQIADHSDVSPSTVYRYFGTKEGIVLWDEYDDVFLAVYRAHLATMSPADAVAATMADVFRDEDPSAGASALEQLRFIASVPKLRAAMAVRTDEFRRAMAAVIVESGWPEPDALIFAGVVVGALTGALESWAESGKTSSMVSAI